MCISEEMIKKVSQKIDKFEAGKFAFLENLGVICRGKSLENLFHIKNKFEHCMLVGAHENSMKKLGNLISGKKIINKLNIKLDLMSPEIYQELGIKDIIVGLTRDEKGNLPKEHILNDIRKKYNLNFVDLPFELRQFFMKEPRTISNGECSATICGFLGIKNVHFIGLDFYSSPYFSKEKVPSASLKRKKKQLIASFYKTCRNFPNTCFHLYTYCDFLEEDFCNLNTFVFAK